MTTVQPLRQPAHDVFTVADAHELAIVTRSGIVESRHAGSAVVVDPDGTVIRTLGNVTTPVFARSLQKPFQAIAVINSGIDLQGAAAAIAMGSHTGTARHVSLVRSMLQVAGVNEDSLQCPSTLPADSATRREVLAENAGPSRLFMACSGKHAAMILACARNGWPIDSYCEPGHPLQAQIADVVERLTGERPPASGIDGCGTPVFALSLSAIARGYTRMRTSSASSPFALFRNARMLSDAAREHAWAVEGEGRVSTLVMNELGVFAKSGAEGVMAMTAPDGTTVALKILDGSSRACGPVALHLLAQAGALPRDRVDEFVARITPAVRGGTDVVGSVAVSPSLL